GNHYAAPITFFSVLSPVPLMMTARAAAGYVPSLHPALLPELPAAIAATVPPGPATIVEQRLQHATHQLGAVGLPGLLAALYSGIGWLSNLREALSEQWAQVPATPSMPQRILFDLLTLGGLGLALVGSFAITGLVAGFAEVLLGLVGLGDEGWALFLL